MCTCDRSFRHEIACFSVVTHAPHNYMCNKYSLGKMIGAIAIFSSVQR